jgi:hypothetical protein
MHTIAEVLLFLIHRGVIDRLTLCRLWRCSESHASRVLSEERPLTGEQYEETLLHLAERGVYDLHRRTLPPTKVIVDRDAASADGRIDDEMRDAMSAFGRAVDAHGRRDRVGLDEAIADGRAVIARLEAERDRL